MFITINRFALSNLWFTLYGYLDRESRFAYFARVKRASKYSTHLFGYSIEYWWQNIKKIGHSIYINKMKTWVFILIPRSGVQAVLIVK